MGIVVNLNNEKHYLYILSTLFQYIKKVLWNSTLNNNFSFIFLSLLLKYFLKITSI